MNTTITHECNICCYKYNINYICSQCSMEYCNSCMNLNNCKCVRCGGKATQIVNYICTSCKINECKSCLNLDTCCCTHNNEETQPNKDNNPSYIIIDDSQFEYINPTLPKKEQSDNVDNIMYESKSILNNVKKGELIRCPNLGNTCYINSVLQFFLHDKKMMSELLEVFPDCNTIVELINAIRLHYTNVNKLNIYEQCDSNLLLSCILDKINTLFPTKFNPMYGNLLHTCIKCKQCKYVVHQRQFENILYLIPSEESKTIENMLNDSFHNQDVEYKCSKCNTIDSRKTVKLESIPKKIFISIQQIGENVSFEIEQELNFFTFMYKLTSCIEHIGNTETSGHYINYSYSNIDSKWYIHDDDRITECTDLSTFLNQNKRMYRQVYILQYEMITINEQ